MTTRIDTKFAALKAEGRPGFVSYIMSGDPNYDTSLEILRGLPDAGADIIELGMRFTDPMADGVAIQLAAQRALAGGQTLPKTLELVQEFRKQDSETPLILSVPIHQLSMTGLVVALGLLVDGSIVVTDEIRKRLLAGETAIAAMENSSSGGAISSTPLIPVRRGIRFSMCRKCSSENFAYTMNRNVISTW